MKFNPEFAHPKWDTAKHGTPDVVCMGWGGHPEGGPAAALKRVSDKAQTNWIPNEQSTQYEDDWDAQKARSKAFGGRAKDYRAGGMEQGPETLPARGRTDIGAGEAARATLKEPPPAPGALLPLPAKK